MLLTSQEVVISGRNPNTSSLQTKKNLKKILPIFQPIDRTLGAEDLNISQRRTHYDGRRLLIL